MKIRIRVAAMLAPLVLCAGLRAEPFPANWAEVWTPVQEIHDNTVRRTPDGALDIDTGRRGHIYFAGGNSMRDMRVSARLKFLRADDKYSGFSLFLRWNGEVWGNRDGFWIYLRPKFRSLYMQKVMDGKLDRTFDQRVQARRPDATPLEAWLTLRCETAGNRIQVYLNDELHLSVVDDGPFPIVTGRLAFGVADGHVILAELKQENLERSEKLTGLTYRYINAPTRGDDDREILVDGEVNAREHQAFWRMLGSRPEMVFDLQGEYFVTRAILRAVSSPALNIATAEVFGSQDGETWRMLSMLANRDSRRADAEHTVEGEVRGIARYIKLVLNRPAADQDVELAEVEFYGRPPTAHDRETSTARPYDSGPPLSGVADPSGADPGCLYLSSPLMRVAVHRRTGVIAGLWNLEREQHCLERQHDRYHLATRLGDVQADEYGDRVTAIDADGAQGRIRLRCSNAALPDIRIEKHYRLSDDGRRLIKRTAFVNLADAADRFLTHITGAVAAEDFRRGGVYMGCDRGLGARLFAEDVTVPRQIGALGARNAKVVLLQRYDLGWGVGQFRHKINDVWCRPLTARYYEKENHPPIYLPNGWEVGVCTLHLAPGSEQSTEVQTALYNGRQIDFYRMWRFLPDTRAAWDVVSRPAWQRDLKTAARISPPEMSSDQDSNMMPILRGAEISATGGLWYLTQIHGVWGNWYSRGVVETGEGARIHTDWLKDFIERMHAYSPRVKTGVYTWAWAVHPRSDVYQNHPEWFVSRDRDGQRFNAYSNMVLNHLRLMNVQASMDELIEQFRRVMEEFGGDFFYLDGGGGGANLIDWEHLTVDDDTHWEALYRRIRQVTRAGGDDKAVWFNARTGPHWDIGYYEGIDRSLNAATWRDSADGLSIVKMRQVFDPDQVVVPLYWRTYTLPFFSNYCIGLGITPSSPLGAADLLKKLPYIEAAYETRRMTWLEADLNPDWRVDPRTNIEAYALKHGRAAVISVIDHREDNDEGTVTVSADTRHLGLLPGRPVYAFIYGNRDIREGWQALPEALRRGVYRDSRWGLDMVARLLDVRVIENPGDRLEVTMPSEPHLLRMAVLSHSPAAIFSVDGLRINFWVPDVLDATVSCRLQGDRLMLTTQAPPGGCEVVVCAPPGRRVADRNSSTFYAADTALAVVPMDAGRSSATLKLAVMPSTGAALTVTCPDTVEAGTALTVHVDPGPARVSVCVRRNDVVVAVNSYVLHEGRFALPVPEAAGAANWSLSVSGELDGMLRHGEASFATTGTFEPALPPVYRPKVYPHPEPVPVDITTRGLHVMSAATMTSDGRDGEHVTRVDPQTLTFGGAMADAPLTRYGYAFGGLEVEGGSVLSLRVTNTIHGAWTFHRGRESFKPQYTTTYAGLFIDYQTGEDYTHRVALGLGIMNPKRTSPRPLFGAARKPDAFVMLGDIVHEGNEAAFAIDLAEWAPPDWSGRCWLIAGVSNLFPTRGLFVEVLEASNSIAGKDIRKGKDLGLLYQQKTYRVARIDTPPVIDGQLDEHPWETHAAATGFHILGRAARGSQPTKAWLAYDDNHLYIAFDCTETERPVTVSSEKLWGRDAVDIALNPSGDRATFLQIIVDAAGEFRQFSKHPESKAFSWTGVRVACGKRPNGWAVEMAVPLTEMGLAPTSGTTWTGNFVRYRASDPMLTWSFMPGPAINDPQRFATFVLE